MSGQEALQKREFRLADGAVIKFIDHGSGPVLLLVHGVCMSSAFFANNIEALGTAHRVIALDLRSHGDSPVAETGNTVAQYARDIHELLGHLDVDDVTGVGWSMGSFVLWDYLTQFGTDRVSRLCIVSQGPSDLTRHGWPNGIATVADLSDYLEALQTDFTGFFGEFVPDMFKNALPDEQVQAFITEIAKIGANVGSVILADQTLRDYRDFTTGLEVPHLLVWGVDEKVVKLASGQWLSERLPNAELHIFDESGHCPMWEEPQRFNRLLSDWVAGASPG
ncbi:MAG: alpha/beta hydrolase [Mycobacterium sp.]